jgi:glycosyltransferase involved in cell wall biosynthesis
VTISLALAIGCLALALVPLLVFLDNLFLFRRPAAGLATPQPISVLIPARNEEASIGEAIGSITQQAGVELELLVLDDHSTDSTAQVIEQFARSDARVRRISAPPLPESWCGKQHACWILAKHALFDRLLWIDADVRLEAGALRTLAQIDLRPAPLVSGFPFEETRTWLEVMLIPLIHFILLGFLPLRMMRQRLSPSLGAGCGQLFLADRTAYQSAGGHAAIRASLHDGITLPRAFRRAGFMTDIFDATLLARCRMYDSSAATWRGLMKNATEGIATTSGILPWTIVLLFGQVLPLPLFLYLLANHRSEKTPLCLALLAMVVGVWIRIICAWRFSRRGQGLQAFCSAVTHSIGVVLFLVIQWHAFGRRLWGHRSEWRGRLY